MTEKQLAEFFVEQRVLQPAQAEDVLSEVELNGKTVAQAMMDGGFIDEPSFYETIANGLGTEFIDLSQPDIAPEILRLIPSGLARLHGALPIDMSEASLRVALVDPFDPHIAEDIRFVDLILYQAIQDRASDIHFEPFENEFKIRYRVDGALYEMSPPPRHLAMPVISRVKVMSNMNSAGRLLPQEGRIQKRSAGHNVNLRVSTL